MEERSLLIGEGESMKRSRTVLGVALCLAGAVAGCNDYNNSVQYNTGATITNISPSGLPAGTPTGPTLANCPNTPSGQTNPCFTLFVLGSAANGFQTSTVVEWNGQKLPACTNTSAKNGCTTYLDVTDVNASVPYSLIANPGTAFVNTYTPQSGTGNNGLSNALTFIIYGAPNPSPALASISPTSAGYCDSTNTKCASIPITLAGTNFLPTSQNGGSSVTFTGVATGGIETTITVTSITATQLNATMPGTLLCATDTAQINVINPPSALCLVNCPNLGGGDTNCKLTQTPSNCTVSTQTFTITNASPVNTCPVTTPVTPAVVEETPAVSQDGRYVAYASTHNGESQILLRDTCVGATSECTANTRLVSSATDGTVGNGDSHNAAMTLDGRYVAFSSAATNLIENAPPGRQVYLRDTCIAAPASCKASTVLISTDEEGKLVGSEAILPSISSSGRFVAFLAVTESRSHGSGNNPRGGGNVANSGLRQVFVRDTCLGAANCTPKTTRISLMPGDAPANSPKPAGPALSGLAKQMALAEGKNATVFTPTVPIDDRVFLAIANERK
jgi:hypothetical protein